jgi:predicted transcriptional regulator
MDTQQMMELLLAMREDVKANREEMKQEIRASHEKTQENLKKTMEEMMIMNQAQDRRKT